MNRRFVGWILLCGLVVSAFAMGGCAHPCGYVNVRSSAKALESETAMEWVALAQVLKLNQDVSSTDITIEASLLCEEVQKGLAEKKIYGRKVYVPYRWYTPILKPLGSATIVLPLWVSSSSPHAHGVKPHGFVDYWRDVFSWFNWFSALPTGPRRVMSEEMLVQSEIVYAAIEERSVPLPAEVVTFYFDGVRVAEAVTNENGRVRFDVGQCLVEGIEDGDHHLALVYVSDSGEIIEHRWAIKRAVWQSLVSARDSAQR